MAPYYNQSGMAIAPDSEEKMRAEEQEQKEDNEIWGSGAVKRAAAEKIAKMQQYGSDAGLRLYEKKRDDTPPWPEPFATGAQYNKGGPVIKGEFKHANPTHMKFGQTGDSSLLAKGRK